MLENQVELPRMQCKHILHWGEYFWCMLQLFKDQQGCSTNQCSLRSVKLCRSQTMKLGVNFTRLTEGSIFFLVYSFSSPRSSMRSEKWHQDFRFLPQSQTLFFPEGNFPFDAGKPQQLWSCTFESLPIRLNT